MLNKEFYVKEIIEIVTGPDNNTFGVDRRTKKLYKCTKLGCENCLFSGECRKLRNEWANSEHVDPIKITHAEKTILENLCEDLKLIVRDCNKKLSCFDSKLIKDEDFLDADDGYCVNSPLINLFKFIKLEDDETYKIEDILNNCEVIEDVD